MYRQGQEATDRLFVVTEDHRLFTLLYDVESSSVRTIAEGQVADMVGDTVPIKAVHDARMIGMILLDGLLKVIPIDSKGVLQDAFNIRLPDNRVRDICVLSEGVGAGPAIAYIHQEGDRWMLKSGVVALKEKSLKPGPIAPVVIARGASHVVAAGKGVLVFSEGCVCWHGFNGQTVKRAVPGEEVRAVTAVGKVDADGTRWLAGDSDGQLYLVICAGLGQGGANSGVCSRVLLETLGPTSIANSLSYIDNGVVFVGSGFGDTQLIRLLPERDEETGHAIELIETEANLGPITDFVCVDLDGQGQGQVVTCSGAFRDGSLRVIRNGIGINTVAELDLGAITGVWSMHKHSGDQHHTYLCVSFPQQTLFLGMVDDELGELENTGALITDTKTLYCGTCIADQLVQVTANSVTLVNSSTMAKLDEWKTPNEPLITVVTSYGHELIAFGHGANTMIVMKIENNKLTEMGRVNTEAQMSSVGMNDSTMVIGTWGNEPLLLMYSLKDMQQVRKVELSGMVVPRSIRLVRMMDEEWLFVGLGDGHVVWWHVDEGSGELSQRKVLSLGTKAIQLTVFQDSNDNTALFCGSDRPAVIHSSSNARKLQCSNVNQHNVGFVASFHTSAFPQCLALATERALLVGSMDAIQKLHIRTIHLDEMARRIVHLGAPNPVKGFVVGTVGLGDSPAHLRLLDEVTFERRDSFPLKPQESVCSLTVHCVENKTLIVVGTAFLSPAEPEPSRGRLLVLSCTEATAPKLFLEHERPMSGGVYCIAPLSATHFVVSVNAKIELLEWRPDHSVEHVADHYGHVIALFLRCRGDFILVGDLMRSMTLLRYDQVSNRLEMIAKDYGSIWMTAAEILSEDLFIGADDDRNLYINHRSEEGESSKLKEVANIHLGEQVNVMRYGRLVAPEPGVQGVRPAPLLYCTVNGSLGAVASLTEEQYLLFQRLESKMALAITPIGGLTHAAWRAPHRSVKTTAAHTGFIDGDLVEQYLDLPLSEQKLLADALSISHQDLYKAVEDMARSIK